MNTPHSGCDDHLEPLLIRTERAAAGAWDVFAILISVAIMLAAIATGFVPVATQ